MIKWPWSFPSNLTSESRQALRFMRDNGISSLPRQSPGDGWIDVFKEVYSDVKHGRISLIISNDDRFIGDLERSVGAAVAVTDHYTVIRSYPQDVYRANRLTVSGSREAWSSSEEVIEDLERCGLLFISRVDGSAFVGAQYAAALINLISTRERKRRPTVLTGVFGSVSNLDLSDQRSQEILDAQIGSCVGLPVSQYLSRVERYILRTDEAVRRAKVREVRRNQSEPIEARSQGTSGPSRVRRSRRRVGGSDLISGGLD